MEAHGLVQRPDGTYYDDRLGDLVDVMYEFARMHQMALGPDYLHWPMWMFTWHAVGLKRTIQVHIEERSHLELHISPAASRDDERSATRHYMGKLVRAYILYLPVAPAVFTETLDFARKDAASVTERELTEKAPISSVS